MSAARIGLLSSLLLAPLVALIWVVPAVIGPFAVDCGELPPEECERAWRDVARERADESPALLPITGVRISGATAETPLCGTFILERWAFAEAITYDCL